jgi:hypothetical protein
MAAYVISRDVEEGGAGRQAAGLAAVPARAILMSPCAVRPPGSVHEPPVQVGFSERAGSS